MERIKALVARFGRTVFLFFIGIILIAYIALGVLYMQQAPQQAKLNDQTLKLSAILRTPLPSVDSLNAENEAIYKKLAPFSDTEAIAMMVDLARKDGIDIKEEAGKLRIPIPSRGPAAIGGGRYEALSFKGMFLQGNPDRVAAFLNVLESGSKLENMVLTSLLTEETEVTTSGEDAERRAEWQLVQQAVRDMMTANELFTVPSSWEVSLLNATRFMGDDPSSSGLFEGFPDNKTPVANKGYTGNATPKGGYILYQHDRIHTDNSTLYTTETYYPSLSTKYYYTAEDDGTVRQWDGPNLVVATEYKGNGPTKTEVRATVDITIYFKPK